MYRFNNVDLQSSIPQQTQAQVDQNPNYFAQKVNMPIQVVSNEKTSFDFNQLDLPISNSFDDLISFSKSPQMFEMDSFAPSDGWSSPSNDSVYPSSATTPYGMVIPMDEQHLPIPKPSLSPFLFAELSNYVRIFWDPLFASSTLIAYLHRDYDIGGPAS